MSPREFLIRDTKEWLKRADSDRRACTALIDGGLPEEALFHAQQCAEKALKAFLTWHQTPFEKTHDLTTLRNLCAPLVTTAFPHFDEIDKLTKYAWRFRYPGAPYEPQREEAEEGLRMAAELLDAVASQLNVEFSRD